MDKREVDWSAHMRGYESSGMSIKEYCHAQGLNFKEFKNSRCRYNYQKQTGKNRAAALPSSTPSSFVKFDVAALELRVRIEASGQLSLHGIALIHLPAILETLGALSK